MKEFSNREWILIAIIIVITVLFVPYCVIGILLYVAAALFWIGLIAAFIGAALEGHRNAIRTPKSAEDLQSPKNVVTSPEVLNQCDLQPRPHFGCFEPRRRVQQ